MYTIDELEEEELEEMIPINGGQFYIQGIESIEEFQQIKQLFYKDVLKGIIYKKILFHKVIKNILKGV